MLDPNTIAKPVVGALIGYSTNWLAIKMLFKPHAAKYIGKFRIPFTPGLIPKERERIARSLGTAVGERLLTEEVISKELLDDRVIGHIKSYVIGELLSRDLSIKDIMENVLGDEYPVIVSKIVKTVETYVREQLESEAWQSDIQGLIRDHLMTRYPYNTTLSEMIPETVTEDVAGILTSHKDRISQFIVDESRSEAVVVKLKSVINALIMEKVGALGAMFVNPDDLAASILDYIAKTVFEEEVQDSIVAALGRAIDQGVQMQLSEVLPIGQYESVLDHASKTVSENAASVVRSMDPKPFIEQGVKHFLNMKLHLTSHEKEQIEAQVEVLYKAFVKANIGTFLETFELRAIVESEVNAFSVGDIEQLIFTIVDKELKAITWFGALLGFVMGLAMIFI